MNDGGVCFGPCFNIIMLQMYITDISYTIYHHHLFSGSSLEAPREKPLYAAINRQNDV